MLYFGTYDRGVGRNAVLADGLRATGTLVAECWVPLWRDTAHKVAAVGRPQTLGVACCRLLAAWWRLWQAHRRLAPYDAMIVGATGHLDVPLARLLSRRRHARLVFDPLVSIVETALDRNLLPANSLRLQALRALERQLFRLPDVRLADTAVHRDALAAQTDTARHLWWVVPASAPATFRRLAAPRAERSDTRVRVLYFGQYIPLHGLDTILAAASRLADRPDIEFELVGTGQTLEASRSLAASLGLAHLRFRAEWLTAEELCRQHIRSADVCLGIFGRQAKAGRVVPQKVYASLASGRAVVTADTPAVRELLAVGAEVWVVPPADPEALAAALRLLADCADLRQALASQGQMAYDRRFAPPILGLALRNRLATLLDRPSDSAAPPGDGPSLPGSPGGGCADADHWPGRAERAAVDPGRDRAERADVGPAAGTR